MYIPKPYEENRIPVLHKLMEDQPFACLVTIGTSGLFASHIPMVLDQDGTTAGRLKGHMARANAQWQEYSPEIQALAIFSGSHHYISPSWYPEKEDTGKIVPTWNYAVVHAYGKLNIIQDTDWLKAHVESLTNIHEAKFPVPWKVSDAPADYIESMVKRIVGVELPIERLEGKWKASQNRSVRDRRGVCKGLDELNTHESQAMKAMMTCPADEPLFE